MDQPLNLDVDVERWERDQRYRDERVDLALRFRIREKARANAKPLQFPERWAEKVRASLFNSREDVTQILGRQKARAAIEAEIAAERERISPKLAEVSTTTSTSTTTRSASLALEFPMGPGSRSWSDAETAAWKRLTPEEQDAHRRRNGVAAPARAR